MRRLLIGSCVAFGLALLGTVTASADTMPSPGGGPAFGQHVAAMSPGSGGMAGATFGECVSTMASQGTCPCTMPMP